MTEHENYHSSTVQAIRLIHDIGIGLLCLTFAHSRIDHWEGYTLIGLLGFVFSELILNPLAWIAVGGDSKKS